MRTPSLIFASFLGISFAVGCDSGKSDAKSEKKEVIDKIDATIDRMETKAAKADAKGVTKDAKADGGVKAGGDASELALPETGLKGTAPAGAKVSEMMGSDMVQAPGLVVTVGPGDDKPKTGEDAQKDADMYSPQDPKIDKLEDGYVLTFTNKGGMGTNFHVNVRREIGGKAFWCSTTASQQEQSDSAVAFCKSLKQ